MNTNTPEDVFRAISADFRQRGLTRDDAARELGFKSRQSLSNLLSSKKYLSGLQAIKFHKAFGHNPDFLMKGEGELKGDDTMRYESYRESSAKDVLLASPGASELGLLRSYFRRIIEAWGNPVAKDILSTYQLFESCADVPTLMALMARIETNLQQLEHEYRDSGQNNDNDERKGKTLSLLNKEKAGSPYVGPGGKLEEEEG